MTHVTANAFITAMVTALRAETTPNSTPALAVSLERYPDRDLGIGYGRSSGYGAKSRRFYADSGVQALLRVG